MKQIRIGLLMWFVFLLLGVPVGEAALKKGTAAPTFPALEADKKGPMKILYFFKQSSKPSRKGLEYLKKKYELYEKSGISIFAISKDDPKVLDHYLKEHPLPFSVIKGDDTLFKKYDIQLILPVTYVVGPTGQITDFLEGGGATSHQFITTVAQHSLQFKNSELTEVLYTEVLEENPKNMTALAGLGHSYLKKGKLDRAEEIFSKVITLSAPGAILGKEGMAALHLKRGNPERAISVAQSIQKSDPKNSFVHLIKANVLASRGDQDGALKEYTHAINGKLSTDWQRADAYNQAGRIYSEQEKYAEAESMYDQAVNQNPYSPEILTNRGTLYEKQGQSDKALALYQEALTVDPKDEIALLLSKRIAQHLAFEEDREHQKRVDTLVSELADRFKKGQLHTPNRSDRWSSRPVTVAFLGMKSIGGGLLREGMTDVLQQEIAQRVMASERISVVEREILEKLLTELKLGSSELADPETALKLGKLLAARLIVTGNLVQVPGGIRLSLRIIDPETSAVKIAYSDEMGPNKRLLELADITGEILRQRIKDLYPLRGKIALVEEDNRVIVNLGTKHGIQPGIEMKIIAEGDAIIVDGKIIGHRKKKVGRLEIVEVEEGLSYGKLTEQLATIRKDQKVLEDVGKEQKTF